MLALSHRFRGRTSLSAVFKRGVIFRGGAISLRALKTERKSFRLAVVVSRKTQKSAVKRNQLRRRIYAITRETAESLTSYDIVLTVHDASFNELSHDEFKAALLKLYKKAAILR